MVVMLRFWVGALCFLVGLTVVTQADLGHQQQKDIERLAKRVQHCAESPGFALTVLDLENPGAMYVESGKDASQEKLDIDDVFCIGDATQAFSAILLGMLIENNETVSWDTPVERIIGNHVPLPDLYRTEHLNLKDIFSMRSGLAGMDFVTKAHPYNQKTLIKNLRYSPVAGGFREGYIHNIVLFSLVQEATEALGGDNWHNLMRKYILNPLKMEGTVFSGPSMAAMREGKSMADGAYFYNRQVHSIDDSVYDGLELTAAASSMCTTTRDMNIWFRFLLRRGMDESKPQRRLISEETLDMIYQGIQARSQDGNPVNEGYSKPVLDHPYIRNMNSLGFINGYYRGFQFVSQDGVLPGIQTLITIMPERKLAVHVSLLGDERPRYFAAKVLINMVVFDVIMDDNANSIYNRLCDTLGQMEREHADHTTEVYARRSGSSLRPLPDYVATYKNYAFGDVEVKYNESGDGVLTLEYGKVLYRLDPTNMNDTFQMLVSEGAWWYSTNADWYRDHRKLFAVFGARAVRRAPEDDDENNEHDDAAEDDAKESNHVERVVNVTIAGFDSHSDPVFAINARPPAFEMEHKDVECSAPACLLYLPNTLAIWVFAVMSMAMVYVR